MSGPHRLIGQAYVALSRATGKCGLTVRGWSDGAVRASAKALAFERGEPCPTWVQEAGEGWAAAVQVAGRDAPPCRCGQPARLRMAKSGGPNQGRYFFGCARPGWGPGYRGPEPQCRFFEFAA